MDSFEKKYGIRNNENVEEFHKSRRMFCIYENKLFIAEPNMPYSHAVWFEKEGWISKEKDGEMDNIVRGFVNEEGDVHFYVGYDFRLNKETEIIFLRYLKEIYEKMKLQLSAKIFGGWPIKKEYGAVQNNI